MFRYTAYGLHLASDLELPELLPASATSAAAAPDVAIRLGRLPPPPEDLPSGTFYDVTPGAARAQWSDAGGFSIAGGREFIIDPIPSADPRAVRLCLLGSAFSVLLHQRGLLVLHASAVNVGTAAVGFLGKCGSGKSTTAAALHARGHPLLSDDVIAVSTSAEGRPQIHSAFPHMKLCPDAAEVFTKDVGSLPTVHPDEQKRLRPALEGFAGDMILPLKRLYVLQDADELSITPLAKRDCLPALIRFSFTAHILQHTAAQRSHFEQCGKLIDTVAIKTLRRPRDLGALQRLAEMVESDAHD